jgi:hypothetical protein
MIEIMVVITIISIMSMIAIPKLTGFFSNKRENLAVITGLITKTFDDSFLREKINYLIIHLYNGTTYPEKGSMQITKDVFNRSNGISIVNLKDGIFIDNNRKIFQYKEFNNSFKIEEVLLTSGERIQNGNVLIPFYPQGFSDNVIIHLLVNDEEKISIRILKHLKEPKVLSGYVTFQDNY